VIPSGVSPRIITFYCYAFSFLLYLLQLDSMHSTSLWVEAESIGFEADLSDFGEDSIRVYSIGLWADSIGFGINSIYFEADSFGFGADSNDYVFFRLAGNNQYSYDGYGIDDF